MSGYLAAGAPIEDFIGWLREYAISNRADERLIAKIDDLYMLQDCEADLEKVGNDLTEMEEARDDLADALKDALKALSAMTEMAMHAPLNAGHDMDQSHIDNASQQHREATQVLKRSGPK